jgi:hypothetical protein
MVQFVAAVVADLFTEETGAYAELDLFHDRNPLATEARRSVMKSSS